MDAVAREIVVLAGGSADLSGGVLAATALALAGEIDDPGNSATAKSMCARALLETMDRLRELSPVRVDDRVSELGARRAVRREGFAA